MKLNYFIPQYEPSFDFYEKEAVNKYMENPGFMTEYKKTTEFEEQIASFLKVKHAIVVNNGTISLSLALIALGIKAGDKVLIPDLSMIATANAIKLIGAEPIFIDVGDDLILDWELAKKKLQKNKNIKAIIFVSLNGRGFNRLMWSLIWYCQENNIAIIEDAAQSFGSKNYEGISLGCRGSQIGSFSFSSPKLITTGQGGCLVTDNDKLAKGLRALKDFGRSSGGNDIHDSFGINCKFTELQAVIGLEQLKKVPYRILRKKEIFNLYKKELNGIVNFIETDLNYTVPWFIDIFVERRNELQNFLKENNIGTRAIYPPMHSQKCFDIKENFPKTEYYSSRGLWLPSSITLKDEEIIYICNKIKEFYGK